jgi:Holliday junction resolvasome RuvABC ATP-dependent DNA helicase subunit
MCLILVLIYGQNNINYFPANAGGVQKKVPVVTQKPNSSSIFTGREDVLDELGKIFALQVTSRPMSRHSCLLWGMGGIGKTQICLKFIEEMSHK